MIRFLARRLVQLPPSVALLLILSVGQAWVPQSSAAAEAASNARAETRLQDDLEYLASDQRGGRGPFSAGLAEAAHYIAQEFEEAGLNTELIEGKPFQVFSVRGDLEPGKKNYLSWRANNEPATKLPSDAFQTLSPSTSQTFDLPLVFAGYGITSSRDGYDDYAEIDVQGKAVVVLRHEPDSKGRTGKFAGSDNSKHAYLSTKIANAIEHGASAVIFVTDELALADKRMQEDELLEFKIRMPDDFQPKVPVLHMKRSVLDTMLQRSQDLSVLQWEKTVDQTFQPNSFALENIRVSGETSIEKTKKSQQNVLAVLPGSGELASEVIVVGAHYDHLGLGGSGSLAPWTREIHNGADDNASGTAALLELARQSAAFNQANRRTILFIAFAAEEQGLIGSEFYVRHPLFDLENTVAMLNFDMVGRLRKDRLTAYGFDTAKQFEAWLEEAATEHGIQLNKVAGGYGPSDHASFYGRGIPVLHYFTGFHSDYHRPSDDVERINVQGLRQIVAMNVELLKQVTTQQIDPVRGSEGSLLDLYFGGMGAGGKTDPDEPGRPTRRTLGVAIVRGNTAEVTVGRVVPDSVAQKSGILPGDVIETWNGEAIQGQAEFTAAIQAAKPKQKVPVRIQRGTLKLELEVEF